MADLYTIALDASTKSTGVAIFKNKELIDYKCITQSSRDVLKRIKNMTDEIEKIFNTYKEENVQVIMEQIIPDNLKDMKEQEWIKNQNTFKALFYLQAAIVLMFHYYGKEVEFIGASTWRRNCGIKQGPGVRRDALKENDKQFVKNIYGITVNDDIADSICIGYSKVNEVKPFDWQ